jgi:hypothetical protein
MRVGQYAAPLGRRQVQIEDDHQVEGRTRWAPFDDLGLHPFHVDVMLFGEPTGLGQPDRREVHSGDLPAALGQPHCGTAFPAGKIQGPTRCKIGQLGHEKPVRFSLPDEVFDAVTLVPRLAIHETYLEVESSSGPVDGWISSPSEALTSSIGISRAVERKPPLPSGRSAGFTADRRSSAAHGTGSDETHTHACIVQCPALRAVPTRVRGPGRLITGVGVVRG